MTSGYPGNYTSLTDMRRRSMTPEALGHSGLSPEPITNNDCEPRWPFAPKELEPARPAEQISANIRDQITCSRSISLGLQHGAVPIINAPIDGLAYLPRFSRRKARR